MSDTTTTTTTAPTVRDQLFAQAKSLPDYLSMAESLDPTMAAAIKGQGQSVSATPVGGLVVAAVGFLSSHFGLGWGEAGDAAVASVLFLIGGYLTHLVQGRLAKAKIANAPAATAKPAG
jgi:hypothetical protein